MGIAPPPISLYCTGVILVEACGHSSPPPFPCTVQVLFSSRRSAGCDWDCVLSLHVVGYPEESITFLRLVGVASSRLSLVSVGVGLMSVLSMLFHGTPMIGRRLVN